MIPYFLKGKQGEKNINKDTTTSPDSVSGCDANAVMRGGFFIEIVGIGNWERATVNDAIPESLKICLR